MGEYHLSCRAPDASNRHPASFNSLISSLYFMLHKIKGHRKGNEYVAELQNIFVVFYG